jgi:hypothetical protein
MRVFENDLKRIPYDKLNKAIVLFVIIHVT